MSGRGRRALAAVATLTAFVAPAGGAATEPPERSAARNHCLDRAERKARKLLCPDLRMRPPFDLDRDRTANGVPILRAANSIGSVGDGPAELKGKRKGRLGMEARQRIRTRTGKRVTYSTGAKLSFKLVPDQGRYWKFRDAAEFELWRLNRDGERIERVEVGPKKVYCLRDLKHTRPGMKRSPSRRVFPSCNQNGARKKVKLGTSVGWSDVYPASYHQNWIELDRVRKGGCYAYVHIADPKNGIFERNESNNEASTVVYLTRRAKYKPGRCAGVHDRALPPAQTASDAQAGGPGGGY